MDTQRAIMPEGVNRIGKKEVLYVSILNPGRCMVCKSSIKGKAYAIGVPLNGTVHPRCAHLVQDGWMHGKTLNELLASDSSSSESPPPPPPSLKFN